MFLDKKVLAIIPARGGSKGIPHKNICPLVGKPLIAWTIEAAQKSKYIDKTILSSDDDEIIMIAKKWRCEVPFKRPVRFAQDDSPRSEMLMHAIKKIPNYDYIIMLQPTSPLRNERDIDDCIKFCIGKKARCCISVTETLVSPYWMYSLDEGENMVPVLSIKKERFYQRQKLPKSYQLNGAIFVATRQFLLENKDYVPEKSIAYIMPQERSYDIDTEIDFYIINKKLLDIQKGKLM